MHLSRQTTRIAVVLLIAALLNIVPAHMCSARARLLSERTHAGPASSVTAAFSTGLSNHTPVGRHMALHHGVWQAPDACYLDLVLAMQYFVQAAIFMGFFVSDPAPQGNLIAALLTYAVAMSRLEDYRDCIADQDPR